MVAAAEGGARVRVTDDVAVITDQGPLAPAKAVWLKIQPVSAVFRK